MFINVKFKYVIFSWDTCPQLLERKVSRVLYKTLCLQLETL